MREELHSYSVKYFVCFLASILWFGLQNEGSINEWTFARVCFVYASQRFHGSWKQFYFLTSLHFRIETFLSSLWVLSPRLPQLFRQTFEELSEARDNEYKKLTGKAERSAKKKKNEKYWCGQPLWHFLAFTPLNECSKCFIWGALDSGAWIAMVSGISKHSWPLGYPWGPCQFSKYNGNKI